MFRKSNTIYFFILTSSIFLALFDAGYVRAIVQEVWVNLECATDEIRMTAPRPHPLNPIDRSIQKVKLFFVNAPWRHATTRVQRYFTSSCSQFL